jgi:hypothetical protein
LAGGISWEKTSKQNCLTKLVFESNANKFGAEILNLLTANLDAADRRTVWNEVVFDGPFYLQLTHPLIGHNELKAVLQV